MGMDQQRQQQQRQQQQQQRHAQGEGMAMVRGIGMRTNWLRRFSPEKSRPSSLGFRILLFVEPFWERISTRTTRVMGRRDGRRNRAIERAVFA